MLLANKDLILFNFVFLMNNPIYVTYQCYMNVCRVDELPQGELEYSAESIHEAACDFL